MRRRARNLRRNVVFAVVALLLAVYLGEVGLRLAGVRPAYEADAVGGWRMLPSTSSRTMRAQEGSSFVLSTNPDGLRTDLSRARQPFVQRVAVMGDSTVFGWGVSDGETFADALETALEAKGLRVEVLNAGQPGYSTTQAEQLFTGIVSAYQPDLTILFIPMHDDNRVLVSDREHLEGGEGAVARLRVLLSANSRIYQLLRSALLPVQGSAALVPGRDPEDGTRVPRVSDAERDDNLDRMRAAMKAWGGALAVGHLPFHADLTGHSGDRYSVPWALAYEARTGVPIVDLRSCCGDADGDALVLPNDPGHLNADGNRIVGTASADRVYELLSRSSSR